MLEGWARRKAQKQRRLCELAYAIFECTDIGTEFLELLDEDLAGHFVFPWQPDYIERFGGPVGHAAWIAGRRAAIDVILDCVRNYKLKLDNDLKEKEGGDE